MSTLEKIEVDVEQPPIQEINIKQNPLQEIQIDQIPLQEIGIEQTPLQEIALENAYPIITVDPLRATIPFTKNDFNQIGITQKYYMSIPQKTHKLRNPFVKKIIVEKADAEEETSTFMTPVVCGERLLSTGTMKIYVTIDLSGYTAYEGKIYLEGE